MALRPPRSDRKDEGGRTAEERSVKAGVGGYWGSLRTLPTPPSALMWLMTPGLEEQPQVRAQTPLLGLVWRFFVLGVFLFFLSCLSVQPSDGAWNWQHTYKKKNGGRVWFVCSFVYLWQELSFLLPQLMCLVDLRQKVSVVGCSSYGEVPRGGVIYLSAST